MDVLCEMENSIPLIIVVNGGHWSPRADKGIESEGGVNQWSGLVREDGGAGNWNSGLALRSPCGYLGSEAS